MFTSEASKASLSRSLTPIATKRISGALQVWLCAAQQRVTGVEHPLWAAVTRVNRTGKNQFSCVNLSNFSVQTLTVPGYTPGSLNYAPPAVVSTKQGRRVFFVRTIVENTSKFILKYRLMCADLDQPGTLLLNISVPVPAWATHDENVLLAPAVSFSGEDFSQSSVFFGLFGLSFMYASCTVHSWSSACLTIFMCFWVGCSGSRILWMHTPWN